MYFDGVLKIEAKLLTPMAQLAKDGGLKSRVFAVDTDNIRIFVDVPVYSANGIGGMLRRAGTYILFKKALEKGFLSKIPSKSPGSKNTMEANGILTLYFLYAVGGGSVLSLKSGSDDYSLFRAVKEITDKNPFASLFGLTLNVPSKLIISDLTPVDIVNNEKYRDMIVNLADTIMNKESGDRAYIRIPAGMTGFSNIETIVVVDDIIKNSIFARLFLTDDAMGMWADFTKKFANDQKKKTDEEKDKKQTIQNIQSMPYIPAGIVLSGDVSCKEPLSMVEYGLLLNSIRVLAEQSITDTDGRKYRLAFGSFVKRGFGKVRLNVRRDNVDLFDEVQTESVFDTPSMEINNFEDLEAEALEEFDEWLENMDLDTFTLPLKYAQVNKKAAV